MRRRVVITGMGCINPMGHDVETMWTGLKAARSGVDYITIFDASRFPTRIAAEVKDWNIANCGEDPRRWQYRARHTQFAAGAARQAVDASGFLEHPLDPQRFGVYLGCGEGNQDFHSFTQMITRALDPEGLDIDRFIQVGLESLNPTAELEQEPNMPAGYLAGMFNAAGPQQQLPDRLCRQQPGHR